MELALGLTAGLWVLAARTAADHAAHQLTPSAHYQVFEPFLAALLLLLLLLAGFTAIHWIATGRASGPSSIRAVNALPSRASAGSEGGLGAALGWGMVVVALVPMALAGDLSPNFWFQPRGFGLASLSVATLLVFTLATEVAFRGYIFARLISTMGPTAATLLMSAIYASVSGFHPYSTRLSVFITFLLGMLFSIAYLRTHALWLSWGLHFAWAASMGVVFGLPVGGLESYSSVVDTSVEGSRWVTGGLYGPEGALFTAVVVVIGMAVLYYLTRDFAWKYTHPTIVAAGYPMDVAPPPAHAAMEQAGAARPAPLVQILSSAPSAPSTLPVIEDHLRSSSPKA